MTRDCEYWWEKTDAFVDDEMSPAEVREFEAHLRSCSDCSAEVIERQRLKAEMRSAGRRYEPSTEFQAKIADQIMPRPRPARWWMPLAGAVALVLLCAGIFGQSWMQNQQRNALCSELVDEHVAAFSAANPVDIASDEESVLKPWFKGKVPFEVDVPELENTAYRLVGGKFAFFRREPAAQLIVIAGKSKYSVFMFRDHGGTSSLGEETSPVKRQGYNTMTWTENGVRYFAVSDGPAEDVRKLCELLRDET